jgi:hypothetical protein
MKVEIILNGSLKLVLMPENEIEKSVLAQMSKLEIESKLIESHTQILDKTVQDGLVIQSKNKNEKN